MYSQLPSALANQQFTIAALHVVGINGKIRGYFEAPVELDKTAVCQPLLVINGLAFSRLIGMDILRSHGATQLFGNVPLRF